MAHDKVTKEIANNIFLVRYETPQEIYYEIDNAKYKRLLFSMNFRDSENLMLSSGGLATKTITIPPYTKVQVACLRVVNPRKTSQLKVKYAWEEEDPGEPPADVPKREELAQDIFIYTTRRHSPTQFAYTVFCGKFKRLRFTISFHGSENMALDDGTLSRTIYVEPYQRIELGTLVVRNPHMPWTCKTKYTWEEKPPRISDEIAGVAAATTPGLHRPLLKSKMNPGMSMAITSRTIKHQELAPSLTMSTETLQRADGQAELRFVVDCMKFVSLRLTLDFSRSKNLSLPGGALVKDVVIQPYERIEVARLVTTIPGKWVLQQKVSWVEHGEPGSTSLGSSASYNNVYRKSDAGKWKTSGNRDISPPPVPTSHPGDSIARPPQTAQNGGGQDAARSRVMKAAAKTEFYRRASLSRETPSKVSRDPASLLGISTPALESDSTGSLLLLLRTLGPVFESYLNVFQQEAMDDIGLLVQLARRDAQAFRSSLREIGIKKMGHRETILQAILAIK